MGYLNLGSLLLGLIAWILPIVSLIKHSKTEHKNWVVFSTVSFAACSLSLFFQIVYQDYLAKIEDWSAIMDTSDELVFVSAVLIAVTIVLNVITLIKYRQ
jgi:cytochrome c oxidase subunit 4